MSFPVEEWQVLERGRPAGDAPALTFWWNDDTGTWAWPMPAGADESTSFDELRVVFRVDPATAAKVADCIAYLEAVHRAAVDMALDPTDSCLAEPCDQHFGVALEVCDACGYWIEDHPNKD